MQPLTTLEAHLVPFESSGDTFFCSVHGFAAFGTLGVLYWFKRHSVCTERHRKIFDQYLALITIEKLENNREKKKKICNLRKNFLTSRRFIISNPLLKSSKSKHFVDRVKRNVASEQVTFDLLARFHNG